jgi:hypothetical protein
MNVPADKLAAAKPKTSEEKLEDIIKAFEAKTKTKTENPAENLRELLNSSPDLKKRILDAVDKGVLTSFQALDPKSGAGGSYDPDNKSIQLPMSVLKNSSTDKGAKAELTFVMGHEIQHSFNSTQTAKITSDFVAGVEKLASSNTKPHDYTSLVSNFIGSSRKDEASAHIGGFNAISSQVLKDNPKASLKDLYDASPGRMGDFINRTGTAPKFEYAMKEGLTINKDLTITASKENVEAMGKYYFDKPASVSQLGPNRNLDYKNYYGDYAVRVVAEYEKAYQAANLKADPKYVAPDVQLNMKQLGFKEKLIEQGLKFSDDKPFKYVDTSDGKTKASQFDPVVTPAAPAKAKPLSPLNELTNEADRALYKQAFEGIEKIAIPLGIKDLHQHQTAAAATAFEAKAGGLDKIDQILKSTKNEGLFAVEHSAVGAEHSKRVHVDIPTLQRPIDHSVSQLNNAQTENEKTQAPQKERGPALP